jgi:ferredoxin
MDRQNLRQEPRQELWIDRTRCDGHRLCAELLPERIALDDWGYPIIAPGAVPDHLLDHARRAVAACPVLALKLKPISEPNPRPS